MSVELRAVSKRFGAQVALELTDLEVPTGELLVLLGPSGCGKSTTLRIVAGLEEPTTGQVWIGGRRADDVAPRDRDVAMVFQNYALYPHLTVRDNLAFPLRRRGAPRAEVRDLVLSAARSLGLERLLDRRPGELSGGERQRVAMGRAIVRRPRIFLFDEPLSNLDARLRVELRAEVARLHREAGATSLYVTHDQIEAMALGDRIAVLCSGRVQQIATPAEIYRAPANRFVASFVGSPVINLLAAERVGTQIVAGPMSWSLRAACERLEVGVRPEDVRLDLDPREPNAHVDRVELLGPEAHVYIEAADRRLVARVGSVDAPRRGASVRVWAHASRVHLFDAESGKRIEATP